MSTSQVDKEMKEGKVGQGWERELVRVAAMISSNLQCYEVLESQIGRSLHLLSLSEKNHNINR